METVARAFYRAMIKETLQEMVARRKWRWLERNMQIGDACFLAYKSKFSCPWFRHCRVVEVHPDLQGTVRTVTVCFRPRQGKALRAGTSYPRLPLEIMVVPVQRLIVILPREDQEGEALPTPSQGAQPAASQDARAGGEADPPHWTEQ